MLHNGPPHMSNEGFAYAKRMMDVQNRLYHDEYKCNFTSVIPTNVFGENDNYNLQDSHVFPALIHKCYLAKRDNAPLVVGGTGAPLRQFVYSRDLARVILWVLRSYNEIDPVIVSPDPEAEVPIRQLVEMIAEGMDFHGSYCTFTFTFTRVCLNITIFCPFCSVSGEIQWDKTKTDGQFRKTVSNAKLRGYLPDFQFTPLQEGIRRACKWFIENFDKARR